MKVAHASAQSAVNFESKSQSQDFCNALQSYGDAVRHLNLVLNSGHPSITDEVKNEIKKRKSQYTKRQDLLASKGWCPPGWDDAGNVGGASAGANEWLNQVWHDLTLSARGKVFYAVKQIRFNKMERRILEFNVFDKEINILKDGRASRTFKFSDLRSVIIETHKCADLHEPKFGATIAMPKKYRFLLADMDELNSLIKLPERILQKSHMTLGTLKERVEHIALHSGKMDVCCKSHKYAGNHWSKFRPFWVVLGRMHISIFETREACIQKHRPRMLLSIKEFDEMKVRPPEDDHGLVLTIDRFLFRLTRPEDAEDCLSAMRCCKFLMPAQEYRLLELRKIGLKMVASDIQALDQAYTANCRSEGAIQLLKELWTCVFPEYPCPELASKNNVKADTQSWSRNFGFTHTDPRVSLEGDEFTGCGLLPVHALLYYAKAAPAAFKKLLDTANKTKPRFPVASSMIEICDQLMLLTALNRKASPIARSRAPHLAYLQLSGLRAKVSHMSKKFKGRSGSPSESTCPKLFLQLCCEALCKAARNFAHSQRDDPEEEVARVIQYVNMSLLQHPVKMPILEGLDTTS